MKRNFVFQDGQGGQIAFGSNGITNPKSELK